MGNNTMMVEHDAWITWYPGLPLLAIYITYIAGMVYGWWEKT